MKQLLSILPYKISGNEIYEFAQKVGCINEELFFKRLPKYSVNKEHGNVLPTNYYHQFTYQLKDKGNENFWLFDIHYASPFLDEEISNVGIENLFDNKYIWKDIFNNIKVFNSLNDTIIPNEFIIIADYKWTGKWEDSELHINVIDYLLL